MEVAFMNPYLAAAQAGKNDWWRYLISFFTILTIWFVIGSIPIILLLGYVMMDGNPATNFTQSGFTGISVLLDFSATMLTFFPFIAATIFSIRVIHARPLRTLITSETNVRWQRILTGAAAWFGVAALISITEALLYPGRYVFSLQPLLLLVYTLLALILIPIQTSAEEFFFRGYLLQWIGLKLKNKWLLAFINGVLFFIPHMVNPEMAVNGILMGLNYFAFGFFACLITLQDNGMELALGLHAANNLFGALFANYTVTALPSPALFTVQTLDPVYGLISTTIGMIVFYWIVFRKQPQPAVILE